MKKFLVAGLIVLGIAGMSYGSNIATYYSMPEGDTPNGVRVEYDVECPDGDFGKCVAEPLHGNPMLGVQVSYYAY